MSVGRLLARLLVAAYAVAVAAALLWPDGWAVNRFFVDVYVVGLRFGIQGVSPDDWSTFANAIAFAPLAYGLVVGWPRVKPWWWASGLVCLSVAAELVQRGLARNASVRDVVLNSVGAVAGAALGAWRVKVSERSARLEP